MHLLTRSCHLRKTHHLVCIPSWKFISFQQSSLQKIKMNIIPAAPIVPKTYANKNLDLKRVLSPHLSIYKPEITSMMSITLRMSGFTLSLMAWTVGLIALFAEQNVDFFVNELQKLDVKDCYWSAAKCVVVFPFTFHFVSGMRHLLFDTAKYLEKRYYYASGYTAIILSFILAVSLGMIEDIRNKIDAMLKPDKSDKTNK